MSTSTPISLDQLVESTLQTTRQRVIPLRWDGRVFWLKRAAPARLGWGHRLQRLLTAVLPWRGVLSFTAVVNARSALDREVRIIERLRAKGVLVPEVVLRGADWVLLSDLGMSLEQRLLGAETRSEIHALAKAGAAALRKLHASGGWHGFPLARNIVGLPNDPGFIDFEEDPAATMSPAQCRMRDFILYLHSLGGLETRYAGTLNAAIQAYLKPGSIPADQARLLRLACLFCAMVSPLAWLIWPVRRKLGRDLRDALAVWRALKDLREGTASFLPALRLLPSARRFRALRTKDSGSRAPFA